MVATFEAKGRAAIQHESDHPLPEGQRRMYAICFDMETEALKQNYHASYQNAYGDIRHVLEGYGFAWQQGSVYFGNEKVNAVTCVMAVIDLTRRFGWFADSVRDIRMLRIEELNDLRPAVENAGEGPNLFNG